MPAGRLDLVNDLRIEQGATYILPLMLLDSEGNALNLTTLYSSVRMQIRMSPTSKTPLISLTSATGGGMVMGDGTGDANLTITIPATALDGCLANSGYYNLEAVDVAGNVIRLLEGKVQISLDVTR